MCHALGDLGTAEAMDAWGASKGEALHTQTFLGQPVGCAMALAALDELERALPEVAPKGEWLRGELERRGLTTRGLGLLLGARIPAPYALCVALLQRGYLILPAGEHDPVLAITPPLTITIRQLSGFLEALDQVRA